MPSQNEFTVNAARTPWFYARPVFITVYLLASIVIGLSYTAIQWQKTKNINDGLFVGLLLGATLLLLRGMRAIYIFFRTNTLSFFAFAFEKKNYEEIPMVSERYCHEIFHTVFMSISGICYGLIIASAVFVMDIWKQFSLLRALLFLFLFIINFATGIAFYGMLKFFISSWKLSAYVKVDLWQRENPTTSFFMNMKKKLALLATVYITMSITSIFFSKLHSNFLSLGYSVFAGIIIILVFVLPEIPIRKKLLVAKRKALLTVNNQLQSEFQHALGEAKSENGSIDLAKIEKLILLKEKIEKVSVWPFGTQTASTVFSVIAITILPIILEFILKHLLVK
jgi:hypothetical protein